MSMIIYFLIGIMILAVATVGFGSTLNNSPSLNRIGGNDNVSVPTPDVNITNIVLTESVNTITSATITIKNTDSTSHTYKICIITKANILVSDTPGTSADCSNTASISASTTGSAVINFANPLNSTNVDYSDISVQQTV